MQISCVESDDDERRCQRGQDRFEPGSWHSEACGPNLFGGVDLYDTGMAGYYCTVKDSDKSF